MIAFSFFLYGEALSPGKGVVEGSGAHVLSITFTNDLITLEADKAPLETVLQELSQKTGARFIIHPASISTDLLSISLKGLTFSETVARILKNYSYMMEAGKAPRVTILALKASGEITTKQSGAQVISGGGGNPSVQSGGTPKAEEKGVSVQQSVPQAAEPRPFDLDECQALEYTEKDAAQEIGHLSQDSGDRSSGRAGPGQENPLLKEAREASQKKLEDAKIKRAQKVLATDRCSNLWRQAIEELSRIQDDRVTSTLGEVAATGKTDRLREQATEALWHNTADSEFKNMKGVGTLKKLAQSSDPRVSRISQEALQDYERYTKKRK